MLVGEDDPVTFKLLVSSEPRSGIIFVSAMASLVFYAILPIVLAVSLFRKFRSIQWGSCKDFRSLSGKVYIVTGGTSGIGKETVKGLAFRKATVILACRDLLKSKLVIAEIRKSTKSGELISMMLDMDSFDSVRHFAGEVLKNFPRVDVLINNAGVYIPLEQNKLTREGFEIHFGVNHLSHFLLTNLLLDKLKASAPSRIVIVSSNLHENAVIDFNNFRGEKGWPHFSGFRNPAYSSSKLANVYFCRELANRTVNTGVEVYSLCPGFCYTNLFRHSNLKWYQILLMAPIALIFMRSAYQGSQTILECAVSDSVKGKSGQMFRDCKPYKSKHVFDNEVQKKLWRASEALTMDIEPEF